MKQLMLLLSTCVLLTLNSCFYCPKDQDPETSCYEFDQRQCNGDEWAEDIPFDISKMEREGKMKDYLTEKGIQVEEVTIIEDYHEFVCEACNICPEVDRFFIQIDQDDLAKLDELNLLNLSKITCSEIF